jgi:hypothetical protein
MAACQLEQRRECVSRVAAGALEALLHVVADLLVRQRRQALRHRLLKQGPAGISEQALHRCGRGAGERVGGGLKMVLDNAADLPVGALDGKDVLDLVKHDQAARIGAFVELARKIEQPQQHRLDVRVGVPLQRRAEPWAAQREPDIPGVQQPLRTAAQRSSQAPGVRPLDPHDDPADHTPVSSYNTYWCGRTTPAGVAALTHPSAG